MLAAASSAEVRKAKWDEIDVDGPTGTVSTDHTKAIREHRVPLSAPALEAQVESFQAVVAETSCVAD